MTAGVQGQAASAVTHIARTDNDCSLSFSLYFTLLIPHTAGKTTLTIVKATRVTSVASESVFTT